MRSRLSIPFRLLFLLSALLTLSAAALAADDVPAEDEYEERARVLRISLLKGEVSLKRAGNVEWETARLNAPLVEGDTLATGRDSRLEVQVDSRNFVRVGGDSVLRVVTLREEGIALSLAEGTATVRLSRFDRDKEYFEVDAPKTTVAAEKNGEYRIDVGASGLVRVTVREDGRARIYSQTSGFLLRNNRTARLVHDGAEEGDWELSAAPEYDEWDYWNDERHRYLAQRLRYEGRERYYDPEVYGAEELDLYGDWVYTRDYGYVWRPHVTVVNNYYNWAPYRYGRWVWCHPYGWTWVADEPWGWAPYHYGRWVYYNNNWCWAPRGYGYNYRRAWWRPALVVFVNVNYGRDHHVAWYPLGHGQRDPRGRWWNRRYDPVTPLRSGEVDNIRRANPALLRAVTSVPSREFGAANLRARPANVDLAQRALSGEPISGRAPVVRADNTRAGAPRVGGEATGRLGAAGTGTPNTGGRDVLTINRPAPVRPPRSVPDRTTGAAARTPGVPLDGELRRTRVFNNREPRVAPPSTAGGGGGVQGVAPPNDDSTGVVNRTGARPRVDSSGGGDADSGPRTRPIRPSTPSDASPVGPASGTSPRPRRTESEGRDDSGAPRERPARPSVERPSVERPSAPPVYRPEPRTRTSDPGDRPSPPPRREDPPPSRPAPESRPHQSEPRQPPPPRQESPRQEAPRQERPAQPSPRQPDRPAPSAKPPERSREQADDQR